MTARIIASGNCKSTFSQSSWQVTDKAISVETTTMLAMLWSSRPSAKFYTLAGVNSVDVKSWRGKVFEDGGFGVILLFPIYLCLELLALCIPSDRTHFIALRMSTGNTIWLDDTFEPNDADKIAKAIRNSLGE